MEKDLSDIEEQSYISYTMTRYQFCIIHLKDELCYLTYFFFFRWKKECSLVYESPSLLTKYYFELIVVSSRPLVLLITLSQFFMMMILITNGL